MQYKLHIVNIGDVLLRKSACSRGCDETKVLFCGQAGAITFFQIMVKVFRMLWLFFRRWSFL